MFRANILAQKASNIQGADMGNALKVGDAVRLLGLPNWLLHDLPEDEQVELLAFVGKVMQVQEIDCYGYVWVGLGAVAEHADRSIYSGHAFCVPAEFVEFQL
mgnify:CR=1 FL=1